ncbi:MAG TPA: hypothetical protein VKA89_02725 [Solirubrobacterales bacterium]|nr:hypothetical protein [Solirubrobacterales bacterium]
MYDADQGEKGEDLWKAFNESLIQRLRDQNVLLCATVWRHFFPGPDFNGEFLELYSLYVTDLGRYDPVPSVGSSVLNNEVLIDEGYIQLGFCPRDLSRLARLRRNRRLRRFYRDRNLSRRPSRG